MKQKYQTIIAMACISLTAGCASAPPANSSIKGFDEVKAEVASLTRAPDEAKRVSQELAKEAEKAAIQEEVKEPRFDLVAKDAKAIKVLEMIRAGGGINIVATDDIQEARWSVDIRNVTAKQALDMIKAVYGVQIERKDGWVSVSKPESVAQVFEFNYPDFKRNNSSEISIAKGAQSSGTTGTTSTTSSSNSSSAGGTEGTMQTSVKTSFWDELKKSLDAVAEKSTVISINPLASSVYVKGSPKQVADIGAYLKVIEKNVGRQVTVQAQFIEVELNTEFSTGVNWSAFGRNGKTGVGWLPGGGNINPSSVTNTTSVGSSGSIISTTASLLASGVTGSAGSMVFKNTNFAAMFNFLQEQGKTYVNSSPQIQTLNNQPAIIQVGTNKTLATSAGSSTVTSTTSTITSPTVSTSSFFSGVSLNVTPQISSSGKVKLVVHPSVSDVVQDYQSVNIGSQGSISFPAPRQAIQAVDSIVTLEDGDIAVIGGTDVTKESDESSQIPGVGDAPVIGRAFKNQTKTKARKQSWILIKVTVSPESKN